MSQFARNILGFADRSTPVVPIDVDGDSHPHYDPPNHNRNSGHHNNNNQNNMKRPQEIQAHFAQMANSSATSFTPFENQAVQYWKVYFDFAYYTLLCPFRFVWKPNIGLYKCHTSKMQRVMHWILFFTGTIYFIFKTKSMTKLDPDTHPTLYFDTASYVFETIVLVIVLLLFGTKKALVDRVFRELQDNNRYFYIEATNYKRTRRICTFICICCLATLGLQILETLSDQNWDIEQFVQFWRDDALDIFPYKDVVRAMPTLFGFICFISNLFEKLLNAFGEILFTLTVLMFQNLVGSFEADTRNARNFQEYESSHKVLEHYWWVKHMTSKINHAMNWICGSFIAGNLPFYTTNVFEIWGDGNIFMRVRYVFYCLYWFPTLFLAANSHRKLEEVKLWVSKEEHYLSIENVKLSVFLHEIDFSTVGLGSFGIITVTWHSVTNVLSIILSYALLKSQFAEVKPEDGLQGNATMISNITAAFLPGQ